MLQKINGRPSRACMRLADAAYPAPFAHTLEYSSPARGTWNIVHTGMLVPESHQIYICASGCLRGVVLTAAEMGAMDRFSSLEVREHDLVDTDNERFLIDGISDIVDRLPKRPRAILVFPACVHHFLGVNFRYVYDQLRAKYPDIDWIPCMMDPIRQTRSLTPEQRERREIYRQLRPLPHEEKACNILGSNLPTDPESDLLRLLTDNGWTVRDLTTCKTYDDFLAMAKGQFNIWYNTFTAPAANDCQKRLKQDSLHIPQLWGYNEIAEGLNRVANRIGVPHPDWRLRIAECELALDALHELIGDTPIAIDMSFVFHPFSLARLLLTHGFHVTQLFTDVIFPEDEANFRWVQEHFGAIELWSTKNADLRLMDRQAHAGKILALGQKAAYFNDTPYFVNFIEGGGLFAYEGIIKLAHLMSEAFLIPKDTRPLVLQKGWGGPCCLC